MTDPTPEQLRRQMAMMGRRRFLGRSGLALGGLALGPSLLAACGGDDGGGARSVVATPRPSRRPPPTACASPTGPTTSTRRPSASSRPRAVSAWTTARTSATTRSTSPGSGSPSSRGDDIGADVFMVTDFLVNRLIGLGWLAPLDDANIPNKGNLRAVPARPRLRPRPDLQPPVVLRLHVDRLQPRADRAGDHQPRRHLRPRVRRPGHAVQRPARRPRPGPAHPGRVARRRHHRADRSGRRQGPGGQGRRPDPALHRQRLRRRPGGGQRGHRPGLFGRRVHAEAGQPRPWSSCSRRRG